MEEGRYELARGNEAKGERGDGRVEGRGERNERKRGFGDRQEGDTVEMDFEARGCLRCNVPGEISERRIANVKHRLLGPLCAMRRNAKQFKDSTSAFKIDILHSAKHRGVIKSEQMDAFKAGEEKGWRLRRGGRIYFTQTDIRTSSNGALCIGIKSKRRLGIA